MQSHCRNAATRFLLHTTYSALALNADKNIMATEHTVCIGVDSKRIDDVACYHELWESLRKSGLSLEDGVTYVQYAHDLVRPHLVHALSNFILLEKHEPTADYMADLTQRLVRRHGFLRAWKNTMHLS